MTSVAATDEQVRGEQNLRLKRIGMSGISYVVTFSLVSFCAWAGLISISVVLFYLALIVVVNIVFVGLILTGINLRLRDPSMTMAQILLSLPPPLIVMFFIDEGQARATFLMIGIIPALYGMLALSTSQFIVTAAAFVGEYLLLVAALWYWRPEVLQTSLEIFQILALALVMGEVALIGGYISGMRQKLRQRNRELNEVLNRLDEMAHTDALTGLFNRRHLIEALDQERNRSNRNDGGFFSIGIFDIDHFKWINDTYGHQAGDGVLRRISETITANLRNIDCFGRFGGEEFLLILPETDLDSAHIKAERLRIQLGKLAFPEIDAGLRVTTSVGLTQYRKGESVDHTLARADRALYRAKDNGRNQSRTEPA